MIRIPSLVLPVLGLVALPASAQSCLDQSFVPSPVNNGLEITSSQTVTQTFTVGLAGTLGRVDVLGINHHRGTPTQALEVRVVQTDATGVPNGATLFSIILQPNQVPATRGRLSVDVSSAGINVAVGQVLGLRLSSAAQPSTQTYAWWGEVPGTYPRGQIWLRDTTSLSAWDLSFETFVIAAAATRSYGSGHPGTNGVPSLSASAAPVLGTTIDLLLGNSAGAATNGAMVVGVAQANVPTPLGGTLLVSILVTLNVPIPAAGAKVSQAIPNDPSLCGASLYYQAVQVDAGASATIAFSPGLELTLGG